MQKFMIWLITLYQWTLKPWWGQHCRFYPSCSHYGKEAILRFGAYQGLCLIIKRLLCCHPWHSGGYDPLPEQEKG